MLTDHVRSALALVHELQQKVLERQRFKGYSGRTRIASGGIALLAAAVMEWGPVPRTYAAHLIGWGVVFAAAVVLNGGALLYWFLFDPKVKHDTRRLMPLLDTAPSLFVGGLLTLSLILHRNLDFLFGVWMCMFGLSNIASRYVLPRSIAWVGLFYIVAGTAYLLAPGAVFLNAWPMGVVFFAGELAGGLILHFDDKRFTNLRRVVPIEEAEA